MSNCHVSLCSITGEITVWSLPGENKLAVINYGDVGSGSNDSTTTDVAQSLLVSKDDPVTPPCDGDVIPIKVGCWNLVEFTDGKVKTSFVVKVVSVSNDKKSLTVQSYVSTSYKGETSSAKTCFKKYQGPKMAFLSFQK